MRKKFARYLQQTSMLLCFSLLLGIFLVACGESGGGEAKTVSLKELHWCDKPAMTFQDLAAPQAGGSSNGLGEADNKAKTIDWNLLKANLGFTLYLPEKLPEGSCLVSVSGTVRDSVYGSSFTIGYLLPSHEAVSLSEAPLRSQETKLQCAETNDVKATPTSTETGGGQATATAVAPSQVCTGAKDKTSIVFSQRGETSTQEAFFNDLKADVDWQPAT